MKICISCGMPLQTEEDFPNKDKSKDFCKYCAKEDGSMKSFEECINDYAIFIMENENIDLEDAKIKAKDALIKNPAWKDQ